MLMFILSWWYYKWIIIQLDHKHVFDYDGMFIHIKISLLAWKQGHSFAAHLDFFLPKQMEERLFFVKITGR